MSNILYTCSCGCTSFEVHADKVVCTRCKAAFSVVIAVSPRRFNDDKHKCQSIRDANLRKEIPK